MHRRQFLMGGSQATLAAWLGCAPFSRSSRAAVAQLGEPPLSVSSRLAQLIPGLMREAIVPGVAMAVIEGGKLTWHGAFGVKDAASRSPVTDETLFEAASVSKTVFAYVVLKLAERGVLDLDRPLGQFGGKRFLEGDSRLDAITARHVLSHTSGFQDWRSGQDPLTIHFTPGTKFLYSGEGYYYLQSVVTHLLGHVDTHSCARYEADLEVCASDIDAFMKRQLLVPFGMNHSGYVWSDRWEVARPHDVEGKPARKKQPRATDAARYASAGGLHTTALEYARFLLEILVPKERDEFRLGRPSLDEMVRPHIRFEEPIDGARQWALGWAVQERANGPVLVHSGGQDGYRSLTMASIAKRSGFIVLTNGDQGWKVFHDERFRRTVEALWV